MLRPLLLASALLCPLPALAQSFQAEFRGTVAVGGSDLYGGTEAGRIDATLSFPLTRRLPLRFELGSYLFAVEGKTPHETYAALAWDDRFRIGVVRPAFDAVLPSVFERTAPYLAYERTEYSRAAATVRAMRQTAVPLGLSAAVDLGETAWRVSVHDAKKGGFRAASLSVRHRGDGWELAAALETLDPEEGRQALNAKIGGRVDLGRAGIGLALLHPKANGRPDTLALDFGWQATDTLRLRAMGEITDSGADAWGVALDHALTPRARLLAAATDSPGGTGLHLTLEQRF